jgi:S1/P1 nuclease
MRQLVACFAALALGIASDGALAWGYQGHQVVGSIADQMLTPHASRMVNDVLGFELRIAAPWPDCVRSVKRAPGGIFTYTHDPQFGVPCTGFESADEKSRMEDYVKRNWDNCLHLEEHGCHESYHFADVPIQYDRYERVYAGTSEHDVVSAIRAAIAVLCGGPAPPPFSIKDRKEALFLLAHFVGDLHQPLHVGAIYLAADDQSVTPPPNAGAAWDDSATAGGNFIADPAAKPATNLHAEWDHIAPELGTAASPALLAAARAVAEPAGRVEDWAAEWASETVVASHAAFSGIYFTHDLPVKRRWTAHFTDREAYFQAQNELQAAQLAKAGARLAQIINAVWP